MNFESASAIERKREDLRGARQAHLEKAKEKYEREERKKELAKQRGEDNWMLASVDQRLKLEEQSLKKTKKKKKEKKKRKHKKKKKESSSSSESDSEDEREKRKAKKKKKRRDSSSSNSGEEPAWVEKSQPSQKPGTSNSAVKGPRLERDSWMQAPVDLVPTVTRQDLINRKAKEKEELDKKKDLLNKPGTHAKELNPYWKDGGTGLPDERKGSDSKEVPVIGDAGLSWLRKSYQRCVQQAKEEGRPLEELAAERWGSLEKIQDMIKNAEAAVYGEPKSRSQNDRSKNRFMKPTDSDRDGNSYKRHRHSRSRSRSPLRHSKGERSRTPDRYKNRQRSRSRERRRRSGSRDNYVRRRLKSRSSSRDRRDRSHSRERRRRSRSNSRDRYRKRSRSDSRDRYKRSDVRSRSKERNSARSSSMMKGRFMKPGELEDSRYKGSGSGSSRHSAPAWKKKEFHRPVEPDSGVDRPAVQTKDKKETERRERRKRSPSSSSSSSSSSSDSSSNSSDEESDKGQSSRSKQDQRSRSPVRILTEKEMNDLGAKIVKAEIMGNDELAAKLKAQLEAAREAKKNAPAAPQGQGQKEEDDFVTLTRTDRSGLARPVPESKYPAESGGKRRRRKQKVDTHTGKEGERTKYFDDDDKFDLKTLVEREKLGTAEDQNQMFARLAGRAAQKTDDDFQVDDLFLSNAHTKQSESIQEQRDRAAAIFEHKKMASSLEKCRFCFGNVPKHLIIAIGTKVYLCLPNNKSLTEGHCLIVPMQHVASGTTVDEDVWSEIQIFRRTLTKMFADRDEDVVFMETSMKLKQFPHMCIECVPMEKEVGELAPIYFKKAIQESESEWSQNKKVVDLRQKDIRHSVPKGFPYFAVDFGTQGGFAHVIEDEAKFPYSFGKEIIGGMVDADHRLWKRPPKENFDEQRRKVLQFAEMWKPYDWTQNIAKKVETDSSSSDSD